MIEPEFNKIVVNNEVFKKQEKIKAECNTEIINTELNILYASSFIKECSAKTEDNKIKYFGKIEYSLVYVDKEGKFYKKECEGKFEGDIPFNQKGEFFVNALASVDKTETDGNSPSVKFIAYLIIDFSVKEKKEENCLTATQELITKEATKPVYKEIFGESVYPINEDVEFLYQVSEVLCQNARVKITGVEGGVGTVIGKGEVIVDALLLQNNEECSIIKETKTIPFRAELECLDAMPTSLCSATCFVKNLRSEIAVDEEKQKSNATFFIDLAFNYSVSDEEQLSVIEDVFSLTHQIETVKSATEFLIPTENVNVPVNLSGKFKVKENENVLCLIKNKTELDYSVTENKGQVAGVVISDVLVKGDNYSVIKTENVFNAEFSINENESVKKVVAFIDKENCKKTLNEEGEVVLELSVIVEKQKKAQISYIGNVIEKGEKPTNEAPISIFIPKENEELWSLSKRLNVSPKELAQTNADLQFPLTGKERIVVYRQK